ncbi:hypothetical protein RND59_19015 [Vibrio ruber]|uniref:hypothetical protein n=1 Tax=Vibrio ruber TaxID=184755 RepID=UPI002892B8AB|nr:hypothetical protein [Vibrio ruber]WNJ97296.1 hypothetical protein RND59_19015 [Vibrio ruber]
MDRVLVLPHYVHAKIFDSDKSVNISVYEQVFDIHWDDHNQYHSACDFLHEIMAKKTLPFEESRHKTEFIDYLIDNKLVYIDNKSYTSTTEHEGSSGIEFYNYLFNLVNNQWILEHGETPLAQAMAHPEGNRSLLLGWTLEYFHVTRLAISCLIGFVANPLPPEVQKLAEEFIREELYHERIMVKAFQDTKWEEESVFSSFPLPSTQAYMDFLKDMALRKPHSFFASLFFYEGDDEDLIELSENIPDISGFRKIRESHLQHARINVQGGHSDITGHYFELIPWLTKAQEDEIIEDMSYLKFLYYDMQNEIFNRSQNEADLEGRICMSLS